MKKAPFGAFCLAVSTLGPTREDEGDTVMGLEPIFYGSLSHC